MAEYIKRESIIKWIEESIMLYQNRYSTDMLNMFGLFRAVIEDKSFFPAADVVERKAGNEDLISRQTAIDAIEDHIRACTSNMDGYNMARRHMKELIAVLPSAQPERKTGKWIWDDEGYHCSECFYHAYGNTGEVLSGDWNYCPNCGERMVNDDV